MATILIERIGPGATIQDLGRPGLMHDGVPPGGPLVRSLFLAANRALGNVDTAAALEIPLSSCVMRAESALTVSVDGTVHHLSTDESLTIATGTEAVHYLAVPGGFEVPQALGSRGTLLAAAIGGLDGRMLRRGDRLGSLTASPARLEPHNVTPLDPAAPLRLHRGPDFRGTGLFEQLLATAMRVSSVQDRTGTRLDGPRLPRPNTDRRGSFPMVRGAIQVTSDGSLIVLGPDHPTTGGYPVIAVLTSTDLDAFARRRPGSEVRFEEAYAPPGPIR